MPKSSHLQSSGNSSHKAMSVNTKPSTCPTSPSPNTRHQFASKFLASFKKTEIIADSAEPKSIEEIRRCGFNIKGVIKCNIKTGLDVMKRYKINITKRSLNTIKEFRNYFWLQDKDGNYTNEPVKKFNHTIDAVRYAVITKVLIKNKIFDLDVI